MTNLDDFLQIQCSGCQTRLKVKSVHAGKKFKCPKCKSPVLAPSLSTAKSSSAGNSASEKLPPPEKEQIAVICSLCNTRMYADLNQVGKQISCPDCFTYNTVSKPEKKNPKKSRQKEEEIEEYSLASEDADPSAQSRAAFDTYIAVTCSLCSTLLYGNHDQVGQEITCPDCGSLTVVPQPPKKKPKKQLSAEAKKPVPLGNAIEPPQWTLDDYDTEEQKLPPPPERPMISGVLSFAGYLETWMRCSVLALLGSALPFSGTVMANLGNDDFVPLFVWKALAALCLLSGFILVVTTSATMMSIVKDTAYGLDKILNWPDMLFLDWGVETLFTLAAGFYSLIPGIAIIWILNSHIDALWPVIPIMVFFLYPFVLMSMLETCSFFAPFSAPVLSTYSSMKRYWFLFYLESAGLLISLVFVVWGMFTFLPIWLILFPIPFLIIAGLMIYFRLLGRLAWCCSFDSPKDIPRPDDNPLARQSKSIIENKNEFARPVAN